MLLQLRRAPQSYDTDLAVPFLRHREQGNDRKLHDLRKARRAEERQGREFVAAILCISVVEKHRLHQPGGLAMSAHGC